MALYRCLQENGLRVKALKRAGRQNKQIMQSSALRLYGYSARISLLVFVSRIRLLCCFISGVCRLFPDWIRELFRSCPDAKRFSVAEDFLIIGHRGNPIKTVENTIEACDYAVNRLQANALEIDLCLTKDQHIVLWHDWDPNSMLSYIRQAGLEPEVKYKPFVPQEGRWRKEVSRLTLDELRRHFGYSPKSGKANKLKIQIPTLESFYVWAIRQTKLDTVFFDVKIPAKEKHLTEVFLRSIIELNENYKPPFKIIFLSPEEVIIKEIKRVAADFNCSLDVILPLGIVLDPAAFSAVKRARELENSCASVGRPTVFDVAPWTVYRTLIAHDRDLMNAQPQLDERLYAWTLNKRKELRCLLRMGVNGIITDRAGRLHSLFSKLVKKQQKKVI